jgi:hypothetical protein
MTLSVPIPATYPLRRDVGGVYGLGLFQPSLGLGDGEGQQIAMQSVSSAGAIAAGTAPLWTQAAWAIPVIGGVVAGVALALTAWFNRKGPKQKVATTQIVNELEPMLQKNVAGYLSGPRTAASQAQALANFDAVWNTLVENCRTEEYGDPGVRCVEDRQAGACQWKEAGQCWNWFVGYRDPIANDPGVKPDPVLGAAGNLIDSLTGGAFEGGGGGLGWLVMGGLALVVALSMGGGK